MRLHAVTRDPPRPERRAGRLRVERGSVNDELPDRAGPVDIDERSRRSRVRMPAVFRRHEYRAQTGVYEENSSDFESGGLTKG